MAPEDDIVRPDVASAGLHVSERIGNDVASTQLDLEESLETSRYASHPYAAQPKDVLLISSFLHTRVLAKAEFLFCSLISNNPPPSPHNTHIHTHKHM
jgi:hypothetical protein